MDRLKLDGVFVPHITPFTREGEIDEESLRICVQFWIEKGVSGLVPCGSNGEAPYLSRDERRKVTNIVVDEANGKVPIVVGTGTLSTADTIMFTKDAKDLGADAALVVTPYYFRLSAKEMLEHYDCVFEAVDFPIILYSVPKFTGYTLEPILVSQLADEHENLIGMKDSSGSISLISEEIRLVGKKISVLAGTADVALSTLMLGGRGAVIAVANVFPEKCIDLYKAFKRQDYENAARMQQEITYLNEILVKKHNQLSAIKEALKLRGLPAGYPRRPALPLDAEAKKGIASTLRASEAGLLAS